MGSTKWALILVSAIVQGRVAFSRASRARGRTIQGLGVSGTGSPWAGSNSAVSTVQRWSAAPRTRYSLPSVTTSKTVAGVDFGRPTARFLLGFNHKEVRCIVDGVRQNVHAVAPTIGIRNGYRAPFTTGSSIAQRRRKRESLKTAAGASQLARCRPDRLFLDAGGLRRSS